MNKINILKNSRGISMLELMIVMAIFGMLVVSLFAVFSQIRNIVSATGSAKQFQEEALTARRNSINNVVPESYAGPVQNFSLINYVIVVNYNKDSIGDFGTSTGYVNISNGAITSTQPKYLKKPEYSKTVITVEQSACKPDDGILYIKFDALSGDIEFADNSNTLVGVNECTLKFVVNQNQPNEVVRKVRINKIERTIKLEY